MCRRSSDSQLGISEEVALPISPQSGRAPESLAECLILSELFKSLGSDMRNENVWDSQ